MDNNNQNQEGQQLQIDLSPEIAKGVYTNFQIISHSSHNAFSFTITSKEIGYRTNKRKREKCVRNHDDTYMNA